MAGRGVTGWLLLAVLLAVLLALLPARGARAEAGDGGALLLRARAATGGAAWDAVGVLHRRYDLAADGLEGTLESWADPAAGRYAERVRLDPERRAAGWDGRQGWRQDWAGRVRQEQGEALSTLRAEALWASFAWTRPDRLGGVVSRLEPILADGKPVERVAVAAPGALPLELWLERASAVPLRVVVADDPPVRVDLLDWQPDPGGVSLPAEIEIRSGEDGPVDRLTARATEGLAVDAAPFAAPVPAPPDYRFTGPAPRAVSPLSSTGDAFMIDVTIDGQGPFPFALDTGAADALDADLAQALGLAVRGRLAGQGAGEGRLEIGLARAGLVEIGDLALRDQLFRVLPLGGAGSDPAPPYRGLLGHDFFDRFVVRLDQARQELVASEPAAWPGAAPGLEVPLDFHGSLPVVDGAIDGVAGRFVLDSGQANTLTLFRPFLVRTGLEHRWPVAFTAPVGWGLGGDIVAEVTRGALLSLGPVAVRRPILYLSRQRSGAFADPALAGNVGQGALARFNLTLDYAARCAWFEPLPGFDTADALHMMTLKRSFGGYTVLSVLAGGAAAAAGLRPGDVIERIDGSDALHLDETTLNRVFGRSSGTRLGLSVRSRGRLRDVVVVLRPSV